MSKLRSEFITRKKKVNGFTGVGTQVQDGEDQIFIVAENGEVLLSKLASLVPDAQADGETFIAVTIIQAQPK